MLLKLYYRYRQNLHRVQDLLIIVNITTVVLNLWGAPPQFGATLSQRGGKNTILEIKAKC